MHQPTILLPTDFSSASAAALPHAAALARQTGSRLLVVHVQEPALAPAGGELAYAMPAPDTARVAAQLEQVKPSDASIPVAHRLAMGDPAAEVCRIAAEEKATMIVLGTHGRTGVLRLLMGSVAESILRRAPCPVLAYREAATAPEPSAAATG